MRESEDREIRFRGGPNQQIDREIKEVEENGKKTGAPAPELREEQLGLGFAREKRERDKMRTGRACGCRPCAGEERGLGLAIWGEGESNFWD